jgi:hypothetical protein
MIALVKTEGIRKELAAMLEPLTEQTIEAARSAGKTLDAAVLFGSAAGPSFIPGKSDVNIFMVFDAVDVPLLNALRPVFDRWMKKLRARPVVTDRAFISGSADVFPLEFLEWKERSVAFFGENPVGTITVSLENLRLQIEENLRGKRLRLIQASLEIGSKPAKFQPYLESGLSTFAAVFRNILRLADSPAAGAGDPDAVIAGVESLAGFKLSAYRELSAMKKSKTKAPAGKIESLFQAYLTELDSLTNFVDKMEVNG